jgi:hypothetical protein
MPTVGRTVGAQRARWAGRGTEKSLGTLPKAPKFDKIGRQRQFPAPGTQKTDRRRKTNDGQFSRAGWGNGRPDLN